MTELEINELLDYVSVTTLQGVMPSKETKVNDFDFWMRNVVCNVHYSNDEQMLNAYNKIK